MDGLSCLARHWSKRSVRSRFEVSCQDLQGVGVPVVARKGLFHYAQGLRFCGFMVTHHRLFLSQQDQSKSD